MPTLFTLLTSKSNTKILFYNANGVEFDNCASCIDKILKYVTKSTDNNAEKLGFGIKYFFVWTKNQSRLNYQAIAIKPE